MRELLVFCNFIRITINSCIPCKQRPTLLFSVAIYSFRPLLTSFSGLYHIPRPQLQSYFLQEAFFNFLTRKKILLLCFLHLLYYLVLYHMTSPTVFYKDGWFQMLLGFLGEKVSENSKILIPGLWRTLFLDIKNKKVLSTPWWVAPLEAIKKLMQKPCLIARHLGPCDSVFEGK